VAAQELEVRDGEDKAPASAAAAVAAPPPLPSGRWIGGEKGMDLPDGEILMLESLNNIALRAVCHAYGYQPLGVSTQRDSMLRLARLAMAKTQDAWSVVKARFLLRLSGLGAAQMLEQKTIRIGILAKQQRMAAEAVQLEAAMAAASNEDSDDDSDDADFPPNSFEHCSPGAWFSSAAQFCFSDIRRRYETSPCRYTFSAGSPTRSAACVCRCTAQRQAAGGGVPARHEGCPRQFHFRRRVIRVSARVCECAL
jgi:hypothetical protein